MKSEFIKDKRVLMRVDFNVPIQNGVIQDNYRILKSLPAIKFCLNNNASITLMSHLGRPNGRVDKDYSLEIVKEELQKLLNINIVFSDNCISSEAIKISQSLKPNQIHLLENLRFYKEEVDNDDKFACKLSMHGEVFINEAFGTSHRSHASNVGICKYIQDRFCGFLMNDEYKYLHNSLIEPKEPYTVILGGAKISGKIELIKTIIDKADNILIGGAMAFTFIKAQGMDIGGSFYEENNLDIASKIISKCNDLDVNLVLPVDAVVSDSIENGHNSYICEIDKIKSDVMGFDIGPKSSEQFKDILYKNYKNLY